MTSRKVLDVSIVVGILAILFIPFVVSDSMLFPFITGKAFLFRILVELLSGVWLIALLRDSSMRPRLTWITGAILLFVTIIAIADISGLNPYKSFWSNYERMEGLITILHLVAYFLIVGSVMKTRVRWHVFFNTSIVASVIMSFYVLLQLAGKITINQGGVRVDGTFGNATYLGIYMLFNVFITLLVLFRSYRQDNKIPKWFLISGYGVAILFQLISIYHTATRGVILGLIGGLILLALFVLFFERQQKVLRRTAGGLLICLLVLGGVFFAIRDTQFVKKSQTLSRFASLSVSEINNQGRRYIWPMAISGFKERPILGWGQESFNYVFGKYYDSRMYGQEPWFDRAHNVVLDWLIAGGLLGLLSYLAIFGAFVLIVWKSRGLSTVDKAVLLGLVAAYFFQNLFVFDNLMSYVYFFSILAFVHTEKIREDNKPPKSYALIDKNNNLRIGVSIAIVACVVVAMYCFNVKAIRASQKLIDALQTGQTNPTSALLDWNKVFAYDSFGSSEAREQMVNQVRQIMTLPADDPAKQAYITLARTQLETQIAQTPQDVRYYLFMGILLNRVNDPKGALTYLEKANVLSPKKQSILFEIGFAYLNMGDYKSSLESFKRAYDLAPDFVEAKILYAVAALYAKNTMLANDLLGSLDESVVAADNRIMAAYVDAGRLDLAVKLIERRVSIWPNDLDARFRLAAGYLGLGQRTKSIEMLQKIITDFPQARDRAQYYLNEIKAGRNP